MDVHQSPYQTHWNPSPSQIAERILKEPDTTYVGHWNEIVDGKEKAHVVLYSTKPLGFFGKCMQLFRKVALSVRALSSSLYSASLKPLTFKASHGESVFAPEKRRVVEEILNNTLAQPLDKKMAPQDKEKISQALRAIHGREQQEVNEQEELVKAAGEGGREFVSLLQGLDPSNLCYGDIVRYFPHIKLTVTIDDQEPVGLCTPEQGVALRSESSLTQKKKIKEVLSALEPSSGTSVLPEPVEGVELGSQLKAIDRQLPISLKLFLACASQTAITSFINTPKLDEMAKAKFPHMILGQDPTKDPVYEVHIVKKGGVITELQVMQKRNFRIVDMRDRRKQSSFFPLSISATVTPGELGKTKVQVDAHFEEAACGNPQVRAFAEQCKKFFICKETYTIDRSLNLE